MIELKTYAGSNVTPQNDAILNDANTLNNGIYYGCNVTIKDATTLHINAGQGIVYGRLFEVLDSDIPVSLSPSGTLLGQLYVHIDLSNIAAPIQILVDTGETLAELEDDPQLNIDSGITDMQLATFTVSTVGMSDLVETFAEVEPIRAVLGDADISSIGDGSVKGAIRTINIQLANERARDVMISAQIAPSTADTAVPLAHGFNEFRNISLYIVYGGVILDEITVDRALFVSQGLTMEAIYVDGVSKVQVMCRYSNNTTAILSSTNNSFTVDYLLVGTN